MCQPTQGVLPHSLIIIMNKSQEKTVFRGRQILTSATKLRPKSDGRFQI